MAEAKRSFGTESYFGYLDALPLAQQAQRGSEGAIAAQKASMEKEIADLTQKVEDLKRPVQRLPPQKHLPFLESATYLDPKPFANAPQVYESLIQDLLESEFEVRNQERKLGDKYRSEMKLEDELLTRAGVRQEAGQVLEVANGRLLEAGSHLRTPSYESYHRALVSLQQSVDLMSSFLGKVAKMRSEFEDEFDYRERIAQARADRAFQLKRFYLAMAFLLLFFLGSLAGIVGYVFVFTKEENRVTVPGNEAIPALLGLMWPVLFLVVADRLWSIGKNEPGEEVQKHWLWLALVSIANVVISLILLIVVYVRGIRTINDTYQDEMETATRLRHRA